MLGRVIGTPSGLQGWAFHGGAMQRAPQYDLPGSGYLGAAWLHRRGSLLATLTATQLGLQAWTGSGWSQLGALALGGGNSVAPGPGLAATPASLLVGTATGFEVAAYQNGTLTLASGAGIGGFTAADGVAATQNGSMAAVWSGGALSVYVGDGVGYVETPTWEPPAGSQRILGVTSDLWTWGFSVP